MTQQVAPFVGDYPGLTDNHIRLISEAGAGKPFRYFGTNWPFFVSRGSVRADRR